MNDNIISFRYKFTMPEYNQEELFKYLKQDRRHRKITHHAILEGISKKKFYLEMVKWLNRSLFVIPKEVHYDKPLWIKEREQ